MPIVNEPDLPPVSGRRQPMVKASIAPSFPVYITAPYHFGFFVLLYSSVTTPVHRSKLSLCGNFRYVTSFPMRPFSIVKITLIWNSIQQGKLAGEIDGHNWMLMETLGDRFPARP